MKELFPQFLIGTSGKKDLRPVIKLQHLCAKLLDMLQIDDIGNPQFRKHPVGAEKFGKLCHRHPQEDTPALFEMNTLLFPLRLAIDDIIGFHLQEPVLHHQGDVSGQFVCQTL